MEVSYEGLGKEYAEKYEEYYNADRRELLEFIPGDAKTFLDIGCGSGNFGQLVKKERNCI
ncbi:MAG: methionine biosynthesis protein MetW [Acidobacteriota bacterium]|nr:methionine biosynthesis protein MetW [Acidobacteriota bacterium]